MSLNHQSILVCRRGLRLLPTSQRNRNTDARETRGWNVLPARSARDFGPEELVVDGSQPANEGTHSKTVCASLDHLLRQGGGEYQTSGARSTPFRGLKHPDANSCNSADFTPEISLADPAAFFLKPMLREFFDLQRLSPFCKRSRLL